MPRGVPTPLYAKDYSPSELAELRRSIAAYTVTGPGCWSWLGPMLQGRPAIRLPGNKHPTWVARVVMMLEHDSLGPGRQANHECNNDQCVRGHPDHVYRGSAKCNADDRVASGRARINARTRVLTPEQVMDIYTSSSPHYVLAAEHGVTRQLVDYIKRGKRHAKLTKHGLVTP